jgi:hypothetical protein
MTNAGWHSFFAAAVDAAKFHHGSDPIAMWVAAHCRFDRMMARRNRRRARAAQWMVDALT